MPSVYRNYVGGVQQVVEWGFLGAARGDFGGGEVGVVGQHAHVEQTAAKLRDAGADVADADDPDGLAKNIAAHEGAAIGDQPLPHGAVGFHQAFRQAQQHGHHVLGDGFLVATGLVDDQYAGLRAGIEIDRVVAGAIGGDQQQVGGARQQVGGGVERGREFIARRADLIGVGRGKHGLDDFGGAVVFQFLQRQIGAGRQDIRE
jgi:hypothetical protein